VPESKQELSLSSKMDPTDCWFPTAEELESLDAGIVDQDLFALHERYLGKTLAQCIKEHNSDADLEETISSFFARRDPGASKILVTNAGIAGESGRGGGRPFLVLDGEKRERLVRSEEHYRYAQKNQQILRGVTRPTITEGSICFGFNLAFDNRSPLPPFIPILRGEDSVITTLFRSLASQGCIAYIPWLVHHAGSGEKQFFEDFQPDGAAQIVFADAINVILQLLKPTSFERDMERRFDVIGNLLVEIGQLPLHEFEKLMKALRWQIASAQIAKFEASLKQYNFQPDFWAADLKSFMTEYHKTLLEPDSIVGRDLIQAFGHDNALARQQALIGQFGELLKVWPQLRRAALELRQRDGAFGKRI
jgi:hypothetical protein